MRLEGSELTPPALSKTPISEDVRTDTGTVDAKNGTSDPDLAKIIAAWPELPDAVRSAILAVVANAVGH